MGGYQETARRTTDSAIARYIGPNAAAISSTLAARDISTVTDSDRISQSIGTPFGSSSTATCLTSTS